jgi:N-formylglutamate deformylase
VSAEVFTLHSGSTPLLVSVPHAGTRIPDDVRDRFVDRALDVEDSDWHLDRIYAFVREMGAGLIVPSYSRYLIDLNRPPDNAPMYPGANNTELCPTHFFTGDPLYREGRAPDAVEVAQRRDRYWRPYHEALAAELDRLRSAHGHAIVFDGHSIKSELPWLFEGRLPDLNLGTAGGASCAPSLRTSLAAVLAAQPAFTHVVDGRFKGGYITRHYGRPREHRHAVQLEMCFACYMEELPPFAYDTARTRRLLPVLRSLVETMIAWRPRDDE